MLRNISWTDFTIVVLLLSAIYYLYVLARYYSAELIGILSGRTKNPVRTVPGVAADLQEPVPPLEVEELSTELEEEFLEVSALIDRLRRLIAEAPAEKRIPQEMRSDLYEVLSAYPKIKDSPLRFSINELIVSEWEKYSPVILTEEEVDLMWETGN